MRFQNLKTLAAVLFCLAVFICFAGSAMACPQPTQWKPKVAKECKKIVADAQEQFEKFKEAQEHLKYNPEDLDAQGREAQERMLLNDLIGDGFRKKIADARLRNDKEAVRNFKKFRGKLMAIKDQMGDPPEKQELVGRDMNKKEVLAADLMIKDLNFNIKDVGDKAVMSVKQDNFDAAKQKEVLDGLNAVIQKAQEVENHFQNLAQEAFDEGQTKLANSFQDYANQAGEEKQKAIAASNFAGLAKMLTN